MDAEHDLSLIFAHADGWLIYLYVIAAIVLCWWAWRRYGPRPPAPWGGIARVCRMAALVVVVLALAGPSWRSVSTSTVPGRIVVAVDRSASMTREDGPQGQARILIASDLYRALSREEERIQAAIEWHSIGGVSGSVDPSTLSVDDATGQRSPLGNDVESLSRSVQTDLLLVVSDFRVTEGSSLSVAAEALRRRDIPAWALAVGSEELDPELLLEEVDGSPSLALGERQPFTVRYTARALDADEPLQLHVYDGETLLLEQSLSPPRGVDAQEGVSGEERIELVLDEEGDRELRFRLRQGEHESTVRRQVQVSERRLQVLILAHRPRYELRYLQAALNRDHSVSVHTYLADGGWRRWSPAGPSSLPLRSADLQDYDVVVIGDLAPSDLPREAQSALVQHVRERGAGLVWIPGETGQTAAFQGEELGSLLPVEFANVDALARSYHQESPLTLHRTTLAEERAFLDPDESDWQDLPRLRRIASIERVRDISRVWMRDDHDRPAVISAQFGRGMGLLVAVDDTWRWRRNVGDRYLHRFYSQILRFASQDRASGDRPWRIDANPYRAIPGQSVRLSLMPRAGVGEQASALPAQMVVEMDAGDGRQRLLELPRTYRGSGYSATLAAPAAGTWRIRMVDGLPPDDVASGSLTVVPPSDEMRDPRFDQTEMLRLVEGTGGRWFRDPEALAEALPSLAREQMHERIIPVWDRWWVLLLIVSLLAVEWSLRRSSRLP
ncbi:MAG: hypothetical protein EA401_04865 [Planctomycetota bacterium]|nr:MAG: hypothetical protein EA401_04865 [Planctomycetota bacterium]